MNHRCKRLSSNDITEYKNLMILFGEVFKDDEAYQSEKPSDTYIESFLNDTSNIVLITLENETVVGGLVAYELKKFEQERSEIYIYDLAVSVQHQRKGIATSLIENLKDIAKNLGAYVIFVQADKLDEGAISFYKSLNSTAIETINFDIKP